MFRAGVINTLVTVAGLFGGLAFGGLWGAALGVSLGYCLHLVSICYYLLGKVLRIRLRELKRFLPEVATAIASCVACCVLVQVLPAGVSAIAEASIKAVLVGGILLVGYVLSGQMSLLKFLLKR